MKTFGFIGLGLIGGSIAKALRAHYGDEISILAFDTDITTLLLAKKEGVLSAFSEEISPCFANCDCLFLCAPIATNIACLKKLIPILPKDCILTDVGSVKSDIHKEIADLSLNQQFIGGHPMAGSEKSGYANSSSRLLENAYYVLTPTMETKEAFVRSFSSLLESINALPILMDASMHDYVTAGVSHLPHIIASALVNLIQQSDSPKEYMKAIAAGGFKDITRIASSSPSMWQTICLSNKESIITLLRDYITSLEKIADSLEAKDEVSLYTLFNDAKNYRDTFTASACGPLKKLYGCYVDIPDETGVISTIASLLATKEINLKNIGILHNREFEEGVLQLEFYDDFSLYQAEEILLQNHYVIYKRK